MYDGRRRTSAARLLTAVRAPALPVEAMVLGKSVQEAADLLPRLFNLCRAAQSQAVQRAFGLTSAEAGTEEIRREILRDHLLKLHVSWPAQFGMMALPLPANWATDAGAVRADIFGAAGQAPDTADAFDAWMAGGTGAAAVLRKIDQCFAPNEAATGHLEAPNRQAVFDIRPIENSVASRHDLHPVMRAIAETRGRGPLWRAAARIFDIAACLDDRLPVPVSPRAGAVIVPATRGTYAVTARVEAGRVASFSRVTPTDHLLVSGGILDRTLASLPADKSGLAPLLLDILDPCSPMRLKEETADA